MLIFASNFIFLCNDLSAEAMLELKTNLWKQGKFVIEIPFLSFIQIAARFIMHNTKNGRLERKISEQNIGAAPPSYEEAVGESRSPVRSER